MDRGGERASARLRGHDGQTPGCGDLTRDVEEDRATGERRASRDDKRQRCFRRSGGDALGGVEDGRTRVEIDDRPLRRGGVPAAQA